MTERAAVDERAGWRRWAGLLGAAVLGAVLLFAAVAKALDPAAFARQVEAEGLAIVLPAVAVAFVAIGLEALLGLALLLGVRRNAVLLPAAALVVFFLFLTGRTYWLWANGGVEPAPGCGCFGALVERSPAEAFWQDVLLMVPALGLAFLGRGNPRPAVGRLAVAAFGTLAVVGLALAAPRLPLDDVVTKAGRGDAVAEVCAGAERDRLCLADVVPELAEGEHWVVLTAADGPAESWVDPLNEMVWSGGGPAVTVLTDAPSETLAELRWTAGPAFPIHEVPSGLFQALYRTLPRSLLVEGGIVVRTINGLPPAGAPTAGESQR